MSEMCAMPHLLAIILARANAYSRALTSLCLSGTVVVIPDKFKLAGNNF